MRVASIKALPAAAVRAAHVSPQQHQARPDLPTLSRRGVGAALLGASLAAAAAAPPPAAAAGLESVAPLELPEAPQALRELRARNQAALDEAEAAFQKSDLLAVLKERTESNAAQNKRAVLDKYCARQGELGVGDCGGLRFIPGATRSGAQVRPEWMDALAKKLGVVEE